MPDLKPPLVLAVAVVEDLCATVVVVLAVVPFICQHGEPTYVGVAKCMASSRGLSCLHFECIINYHYQ